jgi:hypothetical protein
MFLTKLKFVTTALIFTVGPVGLAYQSSLTAGAEPPRERAPLNTLEKGPQAPLAREADLEARTRAIEERLAEPIALNIPNRTTLESALKAIKEATRGPNDSGIPIYVDPAGLQEAGAGMNKPIDVVLFDGATPLATNLRSLLRPLGLDYDVRDGFFTVSSRDIVVDQKIGRLSRELSKLKQRLKDAK